LARQRSSTASFFFLCSSNFGLFLIFLSFLSLSPKTPPASTVVVRAAAATKRTDPSQRIVVTGMGIASCFGNDVDTFYNKLLAGESAVGPIDRFDASEFPTNFAAQIRNFDNEG